MAKPTARRRKTAFMRSLAVVAVAIAIGWGAEYYASANWIQNTYPVHEAVDVPTDSTVVVNWTGSRGNNLGMTVRYSGAPDASIPGTTAANEHGISFRPDIGFDPGKDVIVEVEAGRRHHAFTFTTDGEAAQ